MKKFMNSMKNLIIMVLAFAGLAAILAVTIYYFFNNKGKDENTFAETENGWISEEETITDYSEVKFENITRELKGIGELATYEKDYSGFVSVSNCKKGPISGNKYEKLTGNSVTFDYSGTIKVGYDFEDIDYKYSDGEIIVTIPKAKVLDNYAEASNVKEKDNLFNDVNSGEVVTAKLEESKDIELKKAENGKIYDLAEDNLKNMIREQFSDLSNCNIVFESQVSYF